MGTEGIYERYVNFYTDFAFKKLFGTEVNKQLPQRVAART